MVCSGGVREADEIGGAVFLHGVFPEGVAWRQLHVTVTVPAARGHRAGQARVPKVGLPPAQDQARPATLRLPLPGLQQVGIMSDTFLLPLPGVKKVSTWLFLVYLPPRTKHAKTHSFFPYPGSKGWYKPVFY